MAEKASPLRERQLHVPGQSLDETINRLWDDRGLAYFTYALGFTTIATVEWIRWFSPAKSPPWLITGFTLLLVAFCAVGIFRVRRQSQRLKLGRDGERAVAEVLDGLRAEGCIVYHDVVGNGFNVDHVVLSRAGAFVVETKTIRKPPGKGRKPTVRVYEGRIYAGGADLGSQPLEQAKASAGWVYRIRKKAPERIITSSPVWSFRAGSLTRWTGVRERCGYSARRAWPRSSRMRPASFARRICTSQQCIWQCTFARRGRLTMGDSPRRY